MIIKFDKPQNIMVDDLPCKNVMAINLRTEVADSNNGIDVDINLFYKSKMILRKPFNAVRVV